MAAIHLEEGSIFARDFRVLRRLAEGGMGAVYVVEQLSTGHQRALKVMLPQFVADPKQRERFAQEARVGAQIQSAHVVEVAAAGIDEASQTPWIAMELLDGDDLATLLRRRGTLPPGEVAELFDQLGDALGKAHAAGIVHRDLKPENIFVSRSRLKGIPFVAKVLDFGISKIVAEHKTAATVTSTIGSPLWMAPEQANRGAKIRPSTDVWALGLIAFAVLTGRSYWLGANVPDDEFNLSGLLVEIMVSPLDPPSVRAADRAGMLPPGFDGWFSRCVVREPDGRFRDAAEAIAALLPLLSGAPAFAPVRTSPEHAYPPTMPLPTAPVVSPTVASPTLPATLSAPSAPAAPYVVSTQPLRPKSVFVGLTLVGAIVFVGSAVAFWMLPRTPHHDAAHTDAGAPRPIVTTPTDAPEIPSVPGPTDVAVPSSDPPQNAPARDYNAEANRAWRRRSALVSACLERTMRRYPSLPEGLLVVHLTIGPGGQVESATTEGYEHTPDLGTCVAQVARDRPFPPPPNGSATVTFPTRFAAAAAPPPPPPPPPPTDMPETPSRQDVVTALRAVSPQVGACGRSPSPESVVATITFAHTGECVGVEVLGPHAADAVGACVVRAVRVARVSPFHQPTFAVSYPFRLRGQDTATDNPY